jgi:hypothetical protein
MPPKRGRPHFVTGHCFVWQSPTWLFEAGGGTSLYEYCRLARCWRDAHAAAQHIEQTLKPAAG